MRTMTKAVVQIKCDNPQCGKVILMGKQVNVPSSDGKKMLDYCVSCARAVLAAMPV
jgi:hypothetical protein